MDFFDVIKQRYSYRGAFKNLPVPREDLEKIIETGCLAPSGCNAQVVQFMIIDNPMLLKQIGELHTIEAMRTARAMILCLVDQKPLAVYQGMSFQVEDCAAAVENILLAITALGYAGVWIDGWLRTENRADKIAALLNIDKTKIIRVLIPLGLPVALGPRKEKKLMTQRARFL